ncbi:MAG: hypothetical protein HYU60_00065 [Magnetospirillum sp.]|nr:hypothetical protein [Magnetospirillum sp.]
MTVATKTLPNAATQTGAAYKANIDGCAAVHDRVAGAFAPHEQATPNMTVRIDAGTIPQWLAPPLEVAAQSTATIAAPVGNPRKDIVYIDAKTGAVGVATGTPAASPADPAVPAGKVAVARVTLVPSTTVVTNGVIDDLRSPSFLGLGTAAGIDLDTDGALAANSDSRVPSQMAVRTYVAATAIDTVARDWEALNALRILLNTSVASGGLIDGYEWKLASDEWASGSTGYTFNADPPGYYNKATTSQVQISQGAGSIIQSGWGSNPPGAFDGVTNQPRMGAVAASVNSFNIDAYLGKDLGAGNAKVITGFKVWSSSDDGFVYNYSGSVTIDLYGSNTAPANGTDGTLLGSVSGTDATNVLFSNLSISNSAAYRYVWTHWAPYGANTCQVAAELQFFETPPPAYPVMVTPNASVGAPATAAEFYFLWKDNGGGAVVGSDLTVELSCNGGTNYTVSSCTFLAAYDGTYSLYKASASGLTSGTTLKARISVLNSKDQRIGPALIVKR